jgi:hypothetical protein
VAVGDLNGDGRPDLVITRQGSGNVTVLLGNGKGGFGAGVDYAAGTAPGHALLADLTGDGKLSVVVADSATGAVEVLPGNGDGTLGTAESYAAIKSPSGLAAGRFGSSGRSDLAVASASGVAVLLNDGSGRFSSASIVPVSGQPLSIAAADLRGSGHDDLILGNEDGSATVLLGDGAGHFGALPAFAAGSGPLSSVLAADLNHDGKPDLAVTQANSNMVTVLLGKGDGSFGPGTAYTVGNGPSRVISADLTGGGIADLITVNHLANTFSVLAGNGDGTFKPSLDFVAGNTPLDVVAGDFNADGHADLAIVNSADATLTVPLGRGDGTFLATRSYRAQLETKAIAAGDLNGDGRPDLVVSNFCGSDTACAGNGTATVFLANADGSYRAASTIELGSGPVAVALADLNGTKKLDLLVLNRNDKTLAVMTGNGDGTFGEAQLYPLSAHPRALFAGDFNGDGRMDVAIASDCGESTCSQPGTVDVLLGMADGSLHTTASYTVGFSPASIAAADLHGTGHLDLVVANACGADASCKSAGTATMLAGDGTGRFTTAGEISLGSSPSSIAIGNLSGSGLDLAVALRGSNQVEVLHGNGNGGFGAPVTYAAGSAPSALAIGDFNGDGKQDVAVANFQSSTVSVLYGTGSSALKPAVAYPVGAGPESLASVSTRPGGISTLATADGNSGSSPMGNGITIVSDSIDTPTTTLTSSLNPSTVGTAFILDAVMVPGTTGLPQITGSVVFNTEDASLNLTPITDCNGATGETVNVATAANGGAPNGEATCSVTSLAGSASGYSIVAVYGGDGGVNYTASTSNTVTQVVDPGTTSLVMSGSPNPSTVGQPITFTAALKLPSAVAFVPMGTISFSNGATGIASCGAQGLSNVAGTYEATCTTSVISSTAGNYTINAAYTGDSNYAPTQTTAGNALTQAVDMGATSITVTSVPVAPTLGGSATYTAALTLPAGATVAPTMKIAFTDNGTTITGCGAESISLVSGVYEAACTENSLGSGGHAIIASYPGDTNYVASNGTETFSIQSVTSTTGIASSASPSEVNQNVTFTTTVTGTKSEKLTGSVTVTADSTNTLGTCSLLNWSSTTGAASCTVSSATLSKTSGTAHVISALYSGDSNYGSSNAALTNGQTVNAATTTLGVGTSGSPSVVNQAVPVTFTATVTPNFTGTTIPGGTVTFTATPNGGSAGPISGCSGVTLTAGGTATCSGAPLTAGSYAINASYTGDGNFGSSNTTSAASQTVNKGTTSVGVTSSSPLVSGTPTSSVNQNVTFTATITPTPSGSIALNGNVSFTDTPSGKSAAAITNCSNLGLTVTGGVTTATCTTGTLILGSHSIKATYASDSNYTGNTGTVAQSVIAATSNITVTSSSPLVSNVPTSSVNQTVIFTANIPVPSGNTMLSGTVSFKDGTTAIANCQNVTPQATQSTNWVANCTDPSLTAGSHTITASYGGDSSFTVSPGTLTQAVNLATTSLALNANPDPSTVNANVVFTATLTAPSGSLSPNGSVNFTDSVTGNSITNCSAVGLQTVGGNLEATCQSATLALGSHSITAAYGSDTNFATSTKSVALTVNPATTSIALSSSAGTYTVDVAGGVIFTSTITVPTGNAGLTGTEKFTDTANGRTVTICSGVAPQEVGTTANWVATCTDTSLTAGNHTITASYSGDSLFTVNNGTTTQQVLEAQSNTLVTSSSTSTGTATYSSVIFNPSNVSDQVTFTATVTPSAGPVLLSGAVTFSDNGAALTGCIAVPVTAGGVATCVPQAPGAGVTTLGDGANSVVAAYSEPSGAANFISSSGTLTQNVQDFSLSAATAPPVIVTAGFTTGSDLFTAQTMSVGPVSIENFSTASGKPLALSCAVTNSSGTTVTAPACNLFTLGTTTNASTLAVSATGAEPALSLVVDATSATGGNYTVTVSGTDPTTGLVHTAQFAVNVRTTASALQVASGATTNNSGNVTFTVPSGVTLSGFSCPWLAGSGITAASGVNPASFGMACTFGTPTVSGSTITLPVTVTTSGTLSTAAVDRHSDVLIAGVFGLPFLGLLGLAGGKRTRKAFYQLLVLFAFGVAALQTMGCGGSFHSSTTTVSGGTTPPGVYYLLVEGTGSDGKTYEAVLPVDVTVL